MDIDAHDIEALSKPKILVVGDLMLDEFTYGVVSRVSPEAPIPVLHETSVKKMLGGAGNVFTNLRAVGVDVDLLAVIGNDDSGRFLLDLIKAASVKFNDAFLIKEQGRITTVKRRFIADDQQMLRVDHEVITDISASCNQKLLDLLKTHLINYDLLILSDYGKGVLTEENTPEIIQLAHENNVYVLVDPKGNAYQKYAGADLIKPNRSELALSTNRPVDDLHQVKDAARWLKHEFSIKNIIVTLSQDGILALDEQDRLIQYASTAYEITDVSGAGDTVIAILAAALGAGLNFEKAVFIANHAAAKVVSKLGTAVISREEIWRHIRSNLLISSQKGLYSYKEIQEKVSQWHKRNLKVGFTNGCFDLLHPGHVNLLNKGKEKCDRLVVAINSDESVNRLKGPSRPVQDELSRATMLLSLQTVDAVVIFSEDTPQEIINYVTPDLLFKGKDYSTEQIVGAETVKARGGKVEIIDSETNHHTSEIIKKLA